MKRWVLLAAVALLLVALVPSALAAKGVAYVNRDTLNVYKEMDKSSKVVKTLKGGDKVVIFEEDGNWTGVFYINKKNEDKVGYVQSKYLSDVMPEKYCKHEWTQWEVYREATCTRTGLRIRECTVCGTGQSKEIPKLSHEYGKWIVAKRASARRLAPPAPSTPVRVKCSTGCRCIWKRASSRARRSSPRPMWHSCTRPI